jgi:hypothetical protein
MLSELKCSGCGPVVGCCECGDEPLGSGATELVSGMEYMKPIFLVVMSHSLPSASCVHLDPHCSNCAISVSCTWVCRCGDFC